MPVNLNEWKGKIDCNLGVCKRYSYVEARRQLTCRKGTMYRSSSAENVQCLNFPIIIPFREPDFHSSSPSSSEVIIEWFGAHEQNQIGTKGECSRHADFLYPWIHD